MKKIHLLLVLSITLTLVAKTSFASAEPVQKKQCETRTLEYYELYSKQKREDWKDFRSAITHEDNLVDKRLTWLLTFEGLLVAGLFLLVAENKLDAHAKANFPLSIVLAVFFLIASYTSYSVGKGIAASHANIYFIRSCWEQKYPEEKHKPKTLARLTAYDNTISEFLSFFLDCNPKGNEKKKQTYCQENTLRKDIAPHPCNEFPSIQAPFDYRSIEGKCSSTKQIPILLMLMNLLIALFIVPLLIYRSKKNGEKVFSSKEVRPDENLCPKEDETSAVKDKHIFREANDIKHDLNKDDSE